MVLFTRFASRYALLGFRIMQWASAVIVMGIASNFIHNFSNGEHIMYDEVIVSFEIECWQRPLLI